MPRTVAAALVTIGLALTGCTGGTDPDRLQAGDCFDLPASADRIADVSQRPCTESHDGEVFHVFEASAESAPYPTDPEWEHLVFPVCDPIFETYTGTFVGERLDIEYRYFVPNANGWSAGDRRVACFITSPDGSKLDRSHAVP
jgi:hypothetical protein